MTLGNRILKYRKNLGITQEMLAQQLEVTNQAVSKWEADQCCPDIMLLPKLADIFGITIDQLFGREPKPQTETVIHDLPWEDNEEVRAVIYVGRKMVQHHPAAENLKLTIKGGVGEGVYSEFAVSCSEVGGDVIAGGAVNCGEVGGDVVTKGNIKCGDIGGDVSANGDVTCADVAGDVKADGNVTCADVSGDVEAGKDIHCASIEGNAKAGGKIVIEE